MSGANSEKTIDPLGQLLDLLADKIGCLSSRAANIRRIRELIRGRVYGRERRSQIGGELGAEVRAAARRLAERILDLLPMFDLRSHCMDLLLQPTDLPQSPILLFNA
jgi:hypothetical protein